MMVKGTTYCCGYLDEIQKELKEVKAVLKKFENRKKDFIGDIDIADILFSVYSNHNDTYDITAIKISDDIYAKVFRNCTGDSDRIPIKVQKLLNRITNE